MSADIRINPRFTDFIAKEARRRLGMYLAYLVRYIKQEKLSRGRRGSIGDFREFVQAGEPPHVDSGELRNSILWQWTSDTSAEVGTPLRYGYVQEVGMTIRAKGRFMAIPFSADAIRWQKQGGTAMSFQAQSRNLVTLPLRGQNRMLVEFVNGRSARAVIHYLFVTSVTIKPHPYLRPSVDETKDAAAHIFATGTAPGAVA